MASKKPFVVEGMTVKQILSMDPITLSSLNTREMSRALRTVSLAANKRVERLRSQAKYSKEAHGYIAKKSARHNIALDALNAVTKDGMIKGNVFGVGKANTRNKMLEQLADIRQFMDAKTSTIAGAKQVRQNRERKLWGNTTEEAVKRGKTKKEKAAIAAERQRVSVDTYKAWRYYLAATGRSNDHYENFEGSLTILNLIRAKIMAGGDADDGLSAALEKDTESYEYQEMFEDDDDPFNLLG